MTQQSIPLVELFSNDIQVVVDRYRDQGITVSKVLGALDLILLELAMEALKRLEDGEVI